MRIENRALFDSVAELYDRARPSYPDALFDDLVEMSGIPAGGRVLEIGCGTGQATRPIAKRGYQIDAVELGPAMAAVARRNLTAFTNVTVHNAAFEEWPLPAEPYDLVLSATAFHWVDPAAQFTKTAAALRDGGSLAVIETQHVAGGDSAFFRDVQGCYECHMPGTPEGLELIAAEDIDLELDGQGADRFGPAEIRRYVSEETYTTKSYIDVLNTYSGHLELSQTDHAALIDCIATMIDTRFAGRVRKQYLYGLMLRRKSPS